jgi:hypothetical protein
MGLKSSSGTQAYYFTVNWMPDSIDTDLSLIAFVRPLIVAGLAVDLIVWGGVVQLFHHLNGVRFNIFILLPLECEKCTGTWSFFCYHWKPNRVTLSTKRKQVIPVGLARERGGYIENSIQKTARSHSIHYPVKK